MLNQRTYIVNSPELVIAVQRHTKSLSFQPFVAAMPPKLFLVDEKAREIVKRNMDADEASAESDRSDGTYSHEKIDLLDEQRLYDKAPSSRLYTKMGIKISRSK